LLPNWKINAEMHQFSAWVQAVVWAGDSLTPTIGLPRLSFCQSKWGPMAARIIVVHDDPEFRQCAVAALHAAGYDVEAFAGSMQSIDALDAAVDIDLLLTRVMFPTGTPNGVALARMARMKKRGIRSCQFPADPIRLK
jgi:hypothetical protein